MQKFQNFRARGKQQRPHNAAAHRRNAAKPAQTRAAQQMQQHRLGIVVGVVGGGDAVAGQRVKKCVAQAARRFLYAGGPICFRRGRAEVQGNTVLFTEFPHKACVPFGLRAAQAMVEMRSLDLDAQRPPQRPEAPQQRHGVRAAGNGADHALPRRKQGVFAAPREQLSSHCASIRGLRRW